MANVSRIRGFVPVGTLDGSDWNAQCMTMYKAAGTTVTNDLYPGDPVTFSGTGSTAGIPGVAKATAGDGNAILGIIVGAALDPAHLDRPNWIDGADAGYVRVCVGKMVIYEVQADDAVAVTSIGANAPFVQTTANGTATRAIGQSGCELGTVSSATTDQFKIIGFPQREDNTVNSTDNKVLVIINNHVLSTGTGTAVI